MTAGRAPERLPDAQNPGHPPGEARDQFTRRHLLVIDHVPDGVREGISPPPELIGIVEGIAHEMEPWTEKRCRRRERLVVPYGGTDARNLDLMQGKAIQEPGGLDSTHLGMLFLAAGNVVQEPREKTEQHEPFRTPPLDAARQGFDADEGRGIEPHTGAMVEAVPQVLVE